MPLSDIAIRTVKPGERPFKLFDGGGLHLTVTPAGGKLWRLKYRVAGREKSLSLGAYPAVTLAAARDAAGAARARIASGGDPSLDKRRAKAQARQGANDTFAAIATEYLAKRKREGLAEATLVKKQWLVGLLNPAIGHMPVSSIMPADILAPLRKLERKDNLETARRCRQVAGEVLRYAVATARLASDPSRDLKGAIAAPMVEHRAAITDAVKLGQLLRDIDGYEGEPRTRLALLLALHLAQRPGEIRLMRWECLDLEAAVYRIPKGITKMRKPHDVPLSKQSLAILNELRSITGGEDVYRGYVFPSLLTRQRPMSENTLNTALRRLGYDKDEATAHGFRATAKTLLLESRRWSRDVIDRWQSRGPKDPLGSTYDRAEYWPERVALSQWWSEYLDMLRKGAEIVKFPQEKQG